MPITQILVIVCFLTLAAIVFSWLSILLASALATSDFTVSPRNIFTWSVLPAKLRSNDYIRRLILDSHRLFADFTNVLLSDRRVVIVLFAITSCALVVRLYFLWQPMRYDEAFTVTVFATRSFSEIVRNYAVPNNHIFHTILVSILLRLIGDVPWIIRIPAFVSGILLVPITYFAANSLFDRKAALLSAALIASSSALIEFSTNARGYSILIFITVALIGLANYLTKTNNYSAWIFFVTLSAIGFLTIPIMLYPFGALIGWLLISRRLDTSQALRRNLQQIVLATTAVVVLTGLLYAPALVSSGPERLLNNRFVRAEGMFGLADTLSQVMQATWTTWNRDLTLPITVLLMVGFFLYLIYFRQISKERVPQIAVVFIWSLIIVIVMRKVPEWPRVWMFALPIYLMCSAAGLTYLSNLLSQKLNLRPVFSSPLIVLALTVFLSVNVLRSGSILTSEATGTLRSAEEIILFLRDRLGPEDAIVATVPSDAPLRFYLLRHDITVREGLLYFDPRMEHSTFERAYVIVNITHDQTLENVIESFELADIRSGVMPTLVTSFESADVYLIEK